MSYQYYIIYNKLKQKQHNTKNNINYKNSDKHAKLKENDKITLIIKIITNKQIKQHTHKTQNMKRSI